MWELLCSVSETAIETILGGQTMFGRRIRQSDSLLE